MNPFNFNIAMDGKAKLRRWIFYTITAFVLMTAFIAGFVTVYVNSYNVMHSEPIHVLEFYDDGVVILDKYYKYENF
ncbi:MAG: hypothetical protein K2N71_11085 [Oscillospiraceae bacterium]|nr:hypothetical protein [Oscillospiraceae bacterium]